MRSIVVAARRGWNIRRALTLKKRLSGRIKVHIVDDPKSLTLKRLLRIKPEYVFFPHWSWIIPSEIYSAYECVVFHMTDLPFGRGGSPLQNLILRGVRATKVSAIRVEHGLDSGPVYMKVPVRLTGSAQEIYEAVSDVVFSRMIPAMLKKRVKPVPQRGKPTIFARRRPEESRIQEFRSLREVYDFIRMLDAEGYPAAYADFGRVRAEFRKAVIENGHVRAEVVFEAGEKR